MGRPAKPHYVYRAFLRGAELIGADAPGSVRFPPIESGIGIMLVSSITDVFVVKGPWRWGAQCG
jgi:hypothetical protein